MGSVTGAASLRFNGHVLVHEWPLFVDVALETNRIPAGQRPRLSKRGGSVDVVTICTLD